MSQPPAVELRTVSKVYAGGVQAIADISLTIPRGRIVALLGPSGCGKTTGRHGGITCPISWASCPDGISVYRLPASAVFIQTCNARAVRQPCNKTPRSVGSNPSPQSTKRAATQELQRRPSRSRQESQHTRPSGRNSAQRSRKPGRFGVGGHH